MTSWRAAARSVGTVSTDAHRLVHAELDLLLHPQWTVKLVVRRYRLTEAERVTLAQRVEAFARARTTRNRGGGREGACVQHEDHVKGQEAPRVLTSKRPHTERSAR
jgi:hypothetical protein